MVAPISTELHIACEARNGADRHHLSRLGVKVIDSEVYMQSIAGETKLNGDLVVQLVSAGERLTESERAAIIQRGRFVIQELVEILDNEDLGQSDAPGNGYAPIHATRILKDLKAVEAVEVMLRVLSRCDVMDILFSTLIDALMSFGPPIVEPTLRAYAVAENEDQRAAISSVLSRIHVRDSRILSILLQMLEENVETGACDLAYYGDPSALPHLSTALDACKLDRQGGPFANQNIIELAAAIEDLGGRLTKNQAKLLLDVDSAQNKAWAPVKKLL
jgi:hypothetical protein